MKVLERAHICPLTLDREAVDSFLAYGAVIGPNTIFQEIRELEPGHLLRDQRRLAKLPTPSTGHSAVALQRATRLSIRISTVGLADTRTSRARCRFPSGQRCSGGSISFRRRGLQLAGAAGVAMCEESYHASDVAFAEQEFSELPYARQIARGLPHHHEVVTLTGEQLQDLLPVALLRWTSRRSTGSIPTSSRAWAHRWG